MANTTQQGPQQGPTFDHNSSIADHLAHEDPYKALNEAIVENPKLKNIRPEHRQHMGEAEYVLKDGTDLRSHYDHVVDTHKDTVKRRENMSDYKPNESTIESVKARGLKAQSGLTELDEHASKMPELIDKKYDKQVEAVLQAESDGHINKDTVNKKLENLKKERDELKAKFEGKKEAIKTHGEEIGTKASEIHEDIKRPFEPHNSEAAAQSGTAASKKAGKELLRDAEGKIKPLAPTKELAQKELDGMTRMERFGAKRGAAWSHSGGGMKFVRVLGTGAGVVVAGKGLANVLGAIAGGAEKDKDGNPIEGGSKGGKFVMGGVQTAAGLGLAYASLVGGGKAHLLGH